MHPQAHTPSRSSFPLVVGIVIVFLLFWFLASELYVKRPAAAAAPVPADRPSLAEFESKAQRTLNETVVTDAASGKFRLDIERAKKLVVAEASE